MFASHGHAWDLGRRGSIARRHARLPDADRRDHVRFLRRCIEEMSVPRWGGDGLTSRELLELIPGFVHVMNPRVVEQRKALP